MITDYKKGYKISSDTLCEVVKPLSNVNPIRSLLSGSVPIESLPQSEYNANPVDGGVFAVENVGRRVLNKFDCIDNMRVLTRSAKESDTSNP